MKRLLFLAFIIATMVSCGQGSGKVKIATPEDAVEVSGMPGNMTSVNVARTEMEIEPCEGCITIAHLIENSASYAGKVVKIKGEVTKFNPAIMGTNWVHIQDGSKFNEEFDLTLTTQDEVVLGEVVVFEGKITLDKDLGSGYFYPVLMEEAKVIRSL